MQKETFEQILQEIAKKHHVTPQEVRKQMQLAIEEARQNPDPAIQARWASVLHRGDTVTPEDLIAYVAGKSRQY